MGVGQLSESDAVDALRLPFYSSSHPTGSHGWRNQFDLGNPDGNLILASLGDFRSRARLLMGSVLLVSVVLTLFAWSPWFWASWIILLFVGGASFGVKPLPLRRLETLRSKISTRHDPRAHNEDASLRIKRLFAVVLLDALFQVAQPRVEASCERLRVGNPVLDVRKQTLAPGQDQCGESHDRDEQGGPNQPGTRWIVAPVSHQQLFH